MKILMVNEKLTVEGGAEQYLADVSAELKRRGHTVLLCKEKDNVVGLVKSDKPDLVMLHNVFKPSFYQILPKLVPTIHYVHDHRLYSPGPAKMHFDSNTICEEKLSFKHSLLFAYTQKCMSRNPLKIFSLVKSRKKLISLQNNLKMVVANSYYVKRQLTLNGVKKDLIEVLHPAINPGSVAKEIKTKKSVILFAGRLFVEKGVEYLIMAMQAVENAQAWIVGSGWDENRLKDLANRLRRSEKVKFIPWVKNDEIGSYYKAAAIGVVPSVWPEPFGLSGITFMSYGVPVVGFDVGGIKEWLTDKETGFLVKRSDAVGLSKSINLLLKEDKLRRHLGENARKVFQEEFSLEKHTDKLEKLFEKVMR